MDFQQTLNQFQQYMSIGQQLANVLTQAGVVSEKTNATIQHIGSIVTDPSIPNVLQTVQSAAGNNVLEEVLLGLSIFAPHLMPAASTPPTAATVPQV